MLKKIIIRTTLILAFNINCAGEKSIRFSTMVLSHGTAWCIKPDLDKFDGTCIKFYDKRVAPGSTILFLKGPHTTWAFPYLPNFRRYVFTSLDDITAEFTAETGITKQIMQDALNLYEERHPEKKYT